MKSIELEQIRKQLGWSKREMANRLGIKERTIHGYFMEESPIPKPIEKLIKFYAGGYIAKEKDIE